MQRTLGLCCLVLLSGCCGPIVHVTGEATVIIEPDATGGVAFEGTVAGLDVELIDRWAGRADPPFEITGTSAAETAGINHAGQGAVIDRIWRDAVARPETLVDVSVDVGDPTLGGAVDCDPAPFVFRIGLWMDRAEELGVALPAEDVWLNSPDTMGFTGDGPDFPEKFVGVTPGAWGDATIRWDDDKGLSGELIMNDVQWQTLPSVYDGTDWCPQTIGATSTLTVTWSFDDTPRRDYRGACTPSESWG